MANHKSSAKRARQDIKKKENNKVKNSAAKTAVKKVRQAIQENNKEEAQKLLPVAQKLLDRLAKHGVIKAAAAGRKVSRLAGQISNL